MKVAVTVLVDIPDDAHKDYASALIDSGLQQTNAKSWQILNTEIKEDN